MACGLPTIVANPAFADTLGAHRDLLLIDSPRDANGLRERIQRIKAMRADERHRIGTQLRQHVIQQHSLPRLVDRLMSVLQRGELPA